MPQPAAAPPPHDDGVVVEIRTTFSRREEALACAERLVQGRLAACVQVEGPITSVYRWQGSVEKADEFRCVCKTSRERAAACTAAILGAHAYQTPELIVTEVHAAPAYAAWVQTSVAQEPRGGESRDGSAPA